MLTSYVRAAVPLIPGASRLPFVAGGGGELPDRELERELTPDADRLAAYARVCAFTLRGTLPATYPHVLAFPLHMELMTAGDFPFAAMGLVHLRNRIEQRRPIAIGETLGLRVRVADLEPHPKGRTFSILTEARVGEQLVWNGVSTILHRGGGSGERDGRDEEASAPEGVAQWRLPGDLGRRYASVSGDRNPIHLHPLTARALGFPRAIAHGMWTKARCLAALESRLPDAYAVDVRFRRPILLPSTVAFGSEQDGRRIRFAVRAVRGEDRHLDGAVEPLGSKRS